MASGRPRDPYNSSSTSLDTPTGPEYVPQHLAHGRKGIVSTASSDYGDFPAPSSSVPSLPRYTSSLGGHSSSDYSSAPGRPTGRAGPGGARGPSSAGHGTNGAHPLSNTIYSEANRSQTSALGGDEKGRRSQSTNRNANLAGSSGPTVLRRPPPKGNFATRVYRAWTGANVGDSGIDERHVKKKRLGYLDGLKFLASILVLNGTLFDAVLTPTSYPAIQRDSPLYIFRSFGLGLCLLLLLSGRSLIAPLWDAPNPNAQAGGGGIKADPRKPLISWPRLTRAMLVRPFRFVLPVVVVAALQWGLAAGGENRATKNCNAVGMNEPYWSNINNFAGYVTLVFDLFTVFESDTLAGQAFGANLYTAPWFFQASYCVYVVHFMLGNLSTNRLWVYAILIFFSWTSFNYFAVALCGLFIADLAAHGYTARIRKWPVVRKALLWLSLAALALCTQWINPVRDGLDSGLATINVTSLTEIAFADVIFAVCFVFIVETSEIAQALFGNVVMRTLGRLTAGMYLLPPAIVFTAVPNTALSMSNSGSQPSAILGVSWVLTFGICLAISPFFHLFVECPSKLLGEYFADFVERFGATSDPSPAVVANRGISGKPSASAQNRLPAASSTNGNNSAGAGGAAGPTPTGNLLRKGNVSAAAITTARPAGTAGANRDAVAAAVKGGK